MGRPSKFTAERKQKILEALSIGASRKTAAHIAGLEETALYRWIKRGKEATEGTAFHEFYLKVLEAEANPNIHALGVLYAELPDTPALAWKYIERREPGYAPPMVPTVTGSAGPVVINLTLADGVTSPALAMPSTVIDIGEVDDRSDGDPAEDTDDGDTSP